MKLTNAVGDMAGRFDGRFDGRFVGEIVWSRTSAIKSIWTRVSTGVAMEKSGIISSKVGRIILGKEFIMMAIELFVEQKIIIVENNNNMIRRRSELKNSRIERVWMEIKTRTYYYDYYC